jgi:hypothetical protein
MITTKSIIDLCDRAGIDWRQYSGRGMYGSRCLGITTDNAIATILDMVDSAIAQGAPEYELSETASEEEEEINNLCQDRDHVRELIETLQDAKTDSLGLSQILYWPRLEVTADMLGDDSDDSEDE